MRKLMIYPPDGDLYGFPKELPQDYKLDLEKWLESQGYPAEKTRTGINKANYWYEDEE